MFVMLNKDELGNIIFFVKLFGVILLKLIFILFKAILVKKFEFR